MEKRLGGRFGDVRVFRGPFAEAVTKAHRADAVTIANTGMILVREGPRSDPKTALGKALLAHELTHVSQAQRGLHFALEGGESQGAPHEQEAEAVESAVHARRRRRRARRRRQGRRARQRSPAGHRARHRARRRVAAHPVGAARPPVGSMSEVVESREQLQHLARDGALRGHTYRDCTATGVRVPRRRLRRRHVRALHARRRRPRRRRFSRVTLTRVDSRRAQLAERAGRARDRGRLGPDRARPRRRHARRRRVAARAGGQPRLVARAADRLPLPRLQLVRHARVAGDHRQVALARSDAQRRRRADAGALRRRGAGRLRFSRRQLVPRRLLRRAGACAATSAARR